MCRHKAVDLTIIIVNYNTEELVCNCIKSIPQGISKYSYRVVVVDNGSVDESVERIRTQFPAVNVIENHANLGFAAANNKALQAANSSYYLLLNSDTIVREDSLDIVIDFMNNNERCGFASPQLLNINGTLQNTAANFPSLLTELGNKSLLRTVFPRTFYKKTLEGDRPLNVESLVGAALFVRASMCVDIGFYDEDFFFFLEETEWCHRGVKSGWECYLIPQAEIYHIQGQTAKKVPLRVRVEYWSSRYKYFRKTQSLFVLVLLVFGLLIKNIGNIVLNLLAAPFSVKSRYKLKLALYILLWHVLCCPQTFGLRKSINI